MSKAYAGIGSRETPEDICELMTHFAQQLAELGYLLRSGGAEGADRAWESGAGTHKLIFRAKDATPEAIEVARQAHPAWFRCDDYARRLHGRNAMIILGRQLDEPVKFVVGWQDPTVTRGGTRLGMMLAARHNIDVFNLAVPFEFMAFRDMLDELPRVER